MTSRDPFRSFSSIPPHCMIPVSSPSLFSSQISSSGGDVPRRVTNSSNDTNRNISFPILLSGGLSKMQGLYTRLSRELSVMSNGVCSHCLLTLRLHRSFPLKREKPVRDHSWAEASWHHWDPSRNSLLQKQNTKRVESTRSIGSVPESSLYRVCSL